MNPLLQISIAFLSVVGLAFVYVRLDRSAHYREQKRKADAKRAQQRKAWEAESAQQWRDEPDGPLSLSGVERNTATTRQAASGMRPAGELSAEEAKPDPPPLKILPRIFKANGDTVTAALMESEYREAMRRAADRMDMERRAPRIPAPGVWASGSHITKE